jgi:hypothetical protein
MANTEATERQEAIQHLNAKLLELMENGTYATPRGKAIRAAIMRKFEAWRIPGERE